jgi:P27 family predicted phage terminase small subunit
MTKGRKPSHLPKQIDAITDAPDPPEWLPAPGKAEWRRIMPTLIRRGTLTVADMAQVESYCHAVGLMREAQEQVAAEGGTIQAGNGRLIRHPALQTVKDYMIESRRLATELGLTPNSRERLGSREGMDDMFNEFDV